MRIHVNALTDYLTCPLLHYYRHTANIDVSDNILQDNFNEAIEEAFDRAMHKTMFYLFHLVQNGTVPNLQHLRKRWGYLWVLPRSKEQEIKHRVLKESDLHDQKRIEGWNKLQKVMEHYKEEGWGTPIMVDFPYSIKVGRHIVDGSIDLVRVVNGPNHREIVEMVDFMVDYPRSPYVHIRRDWRMTAASIAFRQAIDVQEERIVYHGLISGKLRKTFRQAADYQQLEKLLDTIEMAQQAGITYPTFNERCVTCPYQDHCTRGGWKSDAEIQKYARPRNDASSR